MKLLERLLASGLRELAVEPSGVTSVLDAKLRQDVMHVTLYRVHFDT
jgi:hypothetical protein